MGQEAIVIPIVIDPKAGVAGLRILGDQAARTNAQLGGVTTTGGKFGESMKGVARSFISLNPLVTIGISALFSFGQSLFGAGNKVKELTEAEKRLSDIQKTVAEDLGKEVAQVSKLVAAIQSEVTSRSQKERALAQLKKINPDYFSDLKVEEGLVNNLTTAYNKYMASIVGRAELNVLGKQLEEISATIVDLERKGAKNQVFVPKLTDEYGNQLKYVKGITKEQAEQNKLNMPYSNALQQRDKLLAQILSKQQGITDILTTDEIKIKPGKVTVDVSHAGDVDLVGGEQLLKELPPASAKPKINVDIKYTGEPVKEISKVTDELQRQADMISGTLTPATDAFIDAIMTKQDAIKAFFQGIGNAVKQLIKQLVAAVVQAGILSLLTGGVNKGGLSFGKAFKNILGFAEGGITTGPVSAVVGEGRGTNAYNPEVVSPLDKLKKFFAGMLPANMNFKPGANMGTAGFALSIPKQVMLYGDGRSLNGVLTLEQASQKRNG